MIPTNDDYIRSLSGLSIIEAAQKGLIILHETYEIDIKQFSNGIHVHCTYSDFSNHILANLYMFNICFHFRMTLILSLLFLSSERSSI